MFCWALNYITYVKWFKLVKWFSNKIQFYFIYELLIFWFIRLIQFTEKKKLQINYASIASSRTFPALVDSNDWYIADPAERAIAMRMKRSLIAEISKITIKILNLNEQIANDCLPFPKSQCHLRSHDDEITIWSQRSREPRQPTTSRVKEPYWSMRSSCLPVYTNNQNINFN